MSSTRHADENSPFRQERFASSPEFERGLLANMVARRVSVLDEKADRELIWAIHYFSCQEGGLKKLADDLLEKCADRIGTRRMIQLGKRSGQTYSAEAVREIRDDLPRQLTRKFLLKGEHFDDLTKGVGDAKKLAVRYKYLPDEVEKITAKADTRPTSYPVNDFVKLCRESAQSGVSLDCVNKTESLADFLRELCLDPAMDILNESAGPWYFADLIPALRRHVEDWNSQHIADSVVTSLGTMVHETLDYTVHAKTMTLLEGQARTGKSFSARHWCESHPGRARFVETPPGNDIAGFFRALARGLGVGSFQQYKAVEVRERVESVLLSGDLLLCLDEGHRLWPQVDARLGYPKRIEWVMSMANQGVPICIIATPQFLERQSVFAEFTGWNSAQFIGRLGDYQKLPTELSLEDLEAVAAAVLPEADSKTRRALAAYARTSARYLAAIDAISKRARYNAGRAGRTEATTEDVRKAMQSSVIPSDSNLVQAIVRTNPKKSGSRSSRVVGPTPPASVTPEPPPRRQRNARRRPGREAILDVFKL